PGRVIRVPVGTPSHAPWASWPSATASYSQWGRSPHLAKRTRTVRTGSDDLLAGHGGLAHLRHDVLVARPGHLAEGMHGVGVDADQDPGPVVAHRAPDDAGGLLGRHPGELAVEEVGGGLLVLPRADPGVAGDAGLDAARVQAGDPDRVARDQHLLAQRLGDAADGVLGGVVG